MAQVCNGTLGDPIVGAGTDFGSDTKEFGPEIPNTSYKYVTKITDDGQYMIAKNPHNLFNNYWWQDVTDHGKDKDGYIMIVCPRGKGDIFYQANVDNLCPKTTYEFSAYVLNLLKVNGTNPKLRFTIEDKDGQIIKESVSEEITKATEPTWVKCGMLFTIPANMSTIKIKLTNENFGGVGNDMALDDISFRPCGPTLTPLTSNNMQNIKLCEHATAEIDLNVNVTAGYTNPVYQWQIKNGNDWADLPGETNTKTIVKFVNAVEGTYMYHLVAAEQGNMASANCRIVSDPLTITVMPSPKPIASSNSPVCLDTEIKLDVSEGNTFIWTGPNNFTSIEKNPIIRNATVDMSGDYTVTATGANGCSSSSSVNVQVMKVGTNISSTTICQGSSVNLEASGGTSYSWAPSKGLSDPSSAKTTASPDETTTYTVTISNGTCSKTAQVTIKVVDKVQPSTNISSTSICKGSSVNLEASGGTTYLWSPSTGLSDPSNANTTASPDETTTYTVNISNGTCSETAQVTVNVVDKIQPSTNISSISICKGSSVNLEASGGTTYSWFPITGLSDPSSAKTTASPDKTTTYTVSISNGTCSETAQLTVNVDEKVVPSTNISTTSICLGSSINLEASGGTTYSWAPSKGLSDPSSPKTTASPDETTTYTVTISSATCSETAQVTVNVIRNATADAGEDQTILNEQSTTLKGKVTGDDVSYFWTPSDYLDDPNKLNPVANPPKDITYTLHARSNRGCISSVDDVFIKVFTEIKIPTSFSPNGDAINDSWNIPIAEAFSSPKIKVINRYGQLVYQSTGKFKPWDGKSNGKDLPSGSYFYSIYFNSDSKPYTGWIMLIR
ncbi:gliding motility-associated C-terminal domain-containing protein [Pedobacter yonginense]|uniref:gliding motility-associated C-terminal domain-containing protein n=1 Tax=Pedobacter yonginense TaxID=651869 RepID=UPI00140303FC|nr:gliding motility-associated C-terminal domain-containing protein [Pedobacter yonginense]